MTLAKIIAALGLISMSAVLIYGFVAGDFGADGGEILRNPWGVVSLVDLYTGFTLFSGWIVYREGSFIRSMIWVLLMMVLGFFTASLYVLIALFQSKGDWAKFWMGNKANG
jgi:hypothetical protein